MSNGLNPVMSWRQVLSICGLGVALFLLVMFMPTSKQAHASERPQPTERVIIFSCTDDNQVTCPQRLMTRFNEWTAMHPRYFITGRQVSIGVSEHNTRGYTERYLYAMTLSVFYLNKYGD
ncbi:MAG: hypothetical protein IT405_03555 [Candidatus Yanofskybacteria bacterium]|nr:hypothetical protein [Candidatus Yanofskybacteria bacterium]